MKIKCEYCGTSFDDTKAQCPQCGAPSSGVVRTASDDPLTIEQLKKWYESKGLPPYEKTRFFIGEDYKEPRAFGIYRDADTGNVVVYKNKDNGERVIRYKGSDEAYGVNEIYQRLKQEIIQQKMNNVKKSKSSENGSSSSKPVGGGCLTSLFKGILAIAGMGAALLLIIVVAGTLVVMFTPKDGYYAYQDDYYYYNDSGRDDLKVFEYDDALGDWKYPVDTKQDPGIFKSKRKSKKYFLSENWDSSYSCTDINESQTYNDFIASSNIQPGYYETDNGYYYHYGYDYDDDWYYYDNDDWVSVGSESLPVDLSHPASVSDFYYTPTWDETTQFSDFQDSEEYEENYASRSDSDSDDSDYSWDSDDSWDSGDTDFGSDW